MDRSLYVAMSGARETMQAQAVNNHNLANANTSGFKADLAAFQSRAVQGPGFASRVYATAESTGWSADTGTLNATGQDLDIAIQGRGWFAVQGGDGGEAYTRAGNLHVDSAGLLVTASGLPVITTGVPFNGMAAEITHDIHACVLPNPHDSKALHQAILTALTKDLTVQRRAAHQFAQTHAWPHIASQYDAIFRTIKTVAKK